MAFEGLCHDGPLLGGQTSGQDQEPVLVEEPPDVPAPVTVALDGKHPLESSDDGAELGRRGVPGEVEQSLLGLGGGHPGDEAHLPPGELAPAEGLADVGQVCETVGHLHLLLGGGEVHAAAEREPVGGGAAAPRGPARAAVELGQLEQPPAHRRCHVAGPLCERSLHPLEGGLAAGGFLQVHGIEHGSDATARQ
jgi:hypothetical protein